MILAKTVVHGVGDGRLVHQPRAHLVKLFAGVSADLLVRVVDLLRLDGAVPLEEHQTPYVPCSGLYGTSQCCATDILGIADLKYGNPPATVTSADNFSEVYSTFSQHVLLCSFYCKFSGIERIMREGYLTA
ncbi:Trihydrophobin [Colletotrichum trifolii]|uniref:Trihydrophobin n=1 Tax=Colletotrichum trifolii TaxID=5466 RepID=A0A4R8RJF6_COLTR|nr:Trihydrophobin [Colletotrichum trifolii]